MLKYSHSLKCKARRMRSELTESESLLWSRLRRKQLLGVQFYRQKPIGNYIADFYAPKARLVIEVDGPQHLNQDHARKDELRDEYLKSQGLLVMRFNNLQVLQQLESVVQEIFRTVVERLQEEIPPDPPLQKGGTFSKG